MRIAICDDEKEIRDILSRKIKKICSEAEIFLYQSGKELLLADTQPDLCLLDIQMSEPNGMETAKEFRKTNKKAILIFVTALDDYVFDAFDVGAFHYLLKPFDDAKFDEVINSALIQYNENEAALEEESAKSQEYIMVHAGGCHIKVCIEDIVSAEVFNRIVIIHKLDEDIRYYGKLSDLEKMAGGNFFRTHRAYLVNFKYVEKYDSSVIYLEKGQALIAKQNYSEFVKRYLRYIKECNRR
ncbi:MAG: LytTR family DNA-binding domain-containing protein [Lachnospiraceae bacterium]|nr:LytTR family DNA-binding domain-containing protein [Lachnospiraceae bacterium]